MIYHVPKTAVAGVPLSTLEKAIPAFLARGAAIAGWRLPSAANVDQQEAGKMRPQGF